MSSIGALHWARNNFSTIELRKPQYVPVRTESWPDNPILGLAGRRPALARHLQMTAKICKNAGGVFKQSSYHPHYPILGLARALLVDPCWDIRYYLRRNIHM